MEREIFRLTPRNAELVFHCRTTFNPGATMITLINGVKVSVKTMIFQEFLVKGNWQQFPAEFPSSPRYPSVRVVHKTTTFPASRAERYLVEYTITGDRSAQYVAECLPTATIVSSEPSCIRAKWSF